MSAADLVFFDANAFLGSSKKGTWQPARDRATMISAMNEAGIEKALVWHVAQQDWSIPEGNALASAAVEGEERLWGCWTLLPPQTGETPSGAELHERMKRDRIRAVRLFPGDHRFVAGRTALGSMLDGLARRNVPLVLSVERGGVDYPLVDRLLAKFPRLPCLLCDVCVWGVDRFTRPLLERFVAEVGSGRVLFGTDVPWFDFHYAIAGVLAADITDEDRRNILHRNARKLFGFGGGGRAP